MYTLALLFKGLGSICSGLIFACSTNSEIFELRKKSWSIWDKYSIFSSGFPGYVIAAAYCFIFFSWCSLCLKCFAKDSKSFYVCGMKTLKFLLTIIILGFFSSAIPVLLVEDRSIPHKVEAIIACVRDFVIAVSFFLYLLTIWKLFENPCNICFSSAESKLLNTCIMLIIVMVLRMISIIIYTFVINKYPSYSEFSTNYFWIFLSECKRNSLWKI